MTPTRELALQIAKECKKFSKTLNLRVACVYGGTGISEQVQRWLAVHHTEEGFALWGEAFMCASIIPVE